MLLTNKQVIVVCFYTILCVFISFSNIYVSIKHLFIITKTHLMENTYENETCPCLTTHKNDE